MKNQSHYFYVLQCQDDSFYAGYTIDIERRLKQHNDGKGAKYTRVKSRRPVLLVHSEIFLSKSDAMKQEYAFKQLQRKEKQEYLAFMKKIVNL